MKNIQFYGIDLNKMNSDQLTSMFARIKEEIEYHKYSNNVYPAKIHVYGGAASFLNMMADTNPASHLVICV